MQKVALVTGANSGIGKATAEGLARRGYTVVMACRSRKRGLQAMAEIKADTGHDALALMLADLSKESEVRALAERFNNQYDRLDALVNNAGLFRAERRVADYDGGIEETFAVNHLAPFLLTNLLLETLKKTAAETGEARVVTVSSDAHRGAEMDFGAVREPLPETYSGTRAYGRSKLANVLFTYELARRLDGTGIRATAVHPGVVKTNIFASSSGFVARVADFFSFLYASSDKGAEGPLYLAAAPEAEGITGQYFKKTKPARSSKASYDEALAGRLWRASEAMTGLAA